MLRRLALFLLGSLAVAQAESAKPLIYRHAAEWEKGFVGEITLTNSGTVPVTSWKVDFDLNRPIDSVWGGKVETPTPGHFVITSDDIPIAPGKSLKVPFLGGPGAGAPSRLSLTTVPPLPTPTPSPTPSATPTPAPTPTGMHTIARSGAVRVTFEVKQDWGTGLEAEITVKNLSFKALKDWSLFFDLPREITSLKGGRMLARAGSNYRIEYPFYGKNRVLGPLGTIKLRLTAMPGGLPVPPSRIVFLALANPITQPKFNYAEALQKSLYFYEAQRSGKLPKNNRVAWRSDSALDDGKDVGHDLSGGYYDAGDHVKFTLPLSSALTMLAWGGIQYKEGYEVADQWPQFLETVKWGTDWLLKAHTAPEELYAQVGDADADHAYWGPPETMTMKRPAFKIDKDHPGSDLAGEAAAALAAASILFKEDNPEYSKTLLEHAKQLFEFADKYRGRYTDSVPESQKFYKSESGYEDELVWAAAWLYRATEDPHMLEKAETYFQQWLDGTFYEGTQTWDDKRCGAAILLAQLTRQQIYKNNAEAFLDFWTVGCGGKKITYTPGGLAWLNGWGALRYSANTAFLAFVYGDTVSDPEKIYRNFARRQLDYILGENPALRSYVVGFGNNPPENPHHRASHGSTTNDILLPAVNKNVLFGALVGGPSSANDLTFADNRQDETTNEVALDYNAGFTGALARMVEQYGGHPLTHFPPK